MSTCICPDVPKELQDELIKPLLNDHNWCFLSLQDMYLAGNSLEDITAVIPFRGAVCSRSSKCCGVCTRQCNTRCIQDCLHRLYMWRKMVECTPEAELDKIPLSIRLAVNQKFETLADMSWVVGEIIARNTNRELKKYMDSHGLRPEENPYKMDYSPRAATDLNTGERLVEPGTGRIQIMEWPESGLCPYCLPKVTVDRRKVKNK